MKNILFVSCLMSLALAAGAHAQVQSSTASPTSAPLSKRDRIALCEKKRGVPIDPSDPQPLKVEGKVTRPTPIYQPKPGSPLSTPRGQVILEGIIDEDGCVRQLKVLNSTDEGMSSAALKSIGQWVFQPATLDGRPVRVSYIVTFSAAP
jgi:TonB family protein